MGNLRVRAILIGALTLASFLTLVPTFAGDALPEWWKESLPAPKIALGLDLRGGVHMVYEVQVEKAVEAEVRHLADWMRRRLEEDDIAYDSVRAIVPEELEAGTPATEGHKIEVILEDEASVAAVRKTIADDDGLSVDEGESGGAKLVLAPKQEVLDHRADAAVQQAVEVIRNRIDEYGVAEPTIQRMDTGLELGAGAQSHRILIQLPGVKDPTEAKKLVQDTAQLEFKLIDEGAEQANADILKRLQFTEFVEEGARARARAQVETELGARLPEEDGWHFQIERDKVTRSKIVRAYPRIVHDEVLLSGDCLEDARVSFQNTFNQPNVSFQFDDECAETFEQLTNDNKGKQLAIVLDDTVYSAPVIRSRIPGGAGVIEGNFDVAEAQNLAIVLRAGALPAPLELLEERSVGPELGARSIRQGMFSTALGGLLVVSFMAFYYRGGGVIADVSLVLNVLFLMAGMAAVGATLTLPGIAGIILTLGMAVDGNIIIFERMREELRAGKTPRAAVDAGFERSWWTIIDANLTTLIAAIVLYQFGTGPVRGFAVTLSIGIFTTVLTALYVSRLAFDYLVNERRVKTLSI